MVKTPAIQNITTVHIKERALLSMILSSVEVYRREALGLLIGYRGMDKYVVEYAIPYQTAMKGYAWVAPKSTATERMQRILKHTPLELIGDYHSHTQWGALKGVPTPSGEDIADMERNMAYMIIAVNDRDRKGKNLSKNHWGCQENGTVTGIIDEYEIGLGAYICVEDYKAKAIKIICPGTTGLFSV